MKGSQCSTRSRSQLSSPPPRPSIAIDEELLSAITSDEATAVTEQMSRIYLLLLGMIPVNAENSRPVAQEWEFCFAGREHEGLPVSGWQQFRAEMVEVEDEELRRALEWMGERGIVDLSVKDHDLHLTIRNTVMSLRSRIGIGI